MGGQYAPGDRLTARGVASALGTSVMPVREAFRRLTSEGALEPQSTGATRVPAFDLSKLRDLTEIRLTVEGLAARRAARRVTAEQISTIEQRNAELLRAAARKDRAREARINEQFHFCIYKSAQSVELLRIIEHLWLQMGPYLSWLLIQGHWPERTRGVRAYRHHKDIIQGLRRHNADQTEAALRADLLNAANVLYKHARQLPGLR